MKLSDGYYRKLVADTLTQKQLNNLAKEIINLKNRKPISITKTIIQPIEVKKEVDSIFVNKDSVFIKDYYPNKISPFLIYTNNFSLKTQNGVSNFNFQPIELTEVVTKKEDGLYQVDFKGPYFLELKSIDIQTEPLIKKKKSKIGILFGIDYGTNIKTKKNFLELNSYIRYNKFYIGAGINTNGNIKVGTKIEL